MSAAPLSYTFWAAVVSLSLGSFELKYLSSHVVVPGQRGGGGEASIRPALFRRPPLWLGERDTRTKLHINRHPPRELLSYTTPTTSHQLPQSLKRGEKKEGRDAGEEELLRCAEISQNPDNQLRRSSTSETPPKNQQGPGFEPVWGQSRLLQVLGQLPPTTKTDVKGRRSSADVQPG